MFDVPLTKAVEFRAVLQKGNRVQVPKLVRWEFKMETSQVLKVNVGAEGGYGLKEQCYSRMNRDGRIKIPKLILCILQNRDNGGKSLVGCVLTVRLEPSSSDSS